MIEENICLSCGRDYAYDSANPKGASNKHCSNCRKKNTKRLKKLCLLNIATNDDVKCRICGYAKCIDALNLMDTRSFLVAPEEKERAMSQYVLCNNCKAEVDSGDVEFQVNDSKKYPVDVSFFVTNVVIKKEYKQIRSQDVQSLEKTEVVNIVPEEIKDVKIVNKLT